MRFIFCASCVSYMLNDWNGVNVDKAVNYIKDSLVRYFVWGVSSVIHTDGTTRNSRLKMFSSDKTLFFDGQCVLFQSSPSLSTS